MSERCPWWSWSDLCWTHWTEETWKPAITAQTNKESRPWSRLRGTSLRSSWLPNLFILDNACEVCQDHLTKNTATTWRPSRIYTITWGAPPIWSAKYSGHIPMSGSASRKVTFKPKYLYSRNNTSGSNCSQNMRYCQFSHALLFVMTSCTYHQDTPTTSFICNFFT